MVTLSILFFMLTRWFSYYCYSCFIHRKRLMWDSFELKAWSLNINNISWPKLIIRYLNIGLFCGFHCKYVGVGLAALGKNGKYVSRDVCSLT